MAYALLADSGDQEGDDLLHRDLTDTDPETAEVKVLLPLMLVRLSFIGAFYPPHGSI